MYHINIGTLAHTYQLQQSLSLSKAHSDYRVILCLRLMMIVKTLLLDMAKGIRNWVRIINGCRSWAELNPPGETLTAHYHLH